MLGADGGGDSYDDMFAGDGDDDASYTADDADYQVPLLVLEWVF